MRVRALSMLALVACGGQVGTIDLSLATAPGSTLLDGVQRLRVTITNPPAVVEADRTPSGFDLVLDVEAIGGAGTLIVEGFDATDSLIATGASPPFSISAIDARIVVYMATPLTIAPAPAPLPAARAGVASTKLSYGFAIAGGEDTAGAKTDSIFIYNSFDHSLLAGMAMPAPRAFQTIATASNDTIVLFGGLGTDGSPTGSLWRFNTTVPPNGAYSVLEERVELARANAGAIAIASELHVITGAPPIDLMFDTPTARTDVPSVGRYGGALLDDQGNSVAIFGGDPALILEGGVFRELGVAFDPEDSATAIPGQVVFASARDDTELATVSAAGTVLFLDRLTTVRRDAAIAATDRFVVIAGGRDAADQPIATADILSLDLALVATVPCLARSGATAHAMPNGQIAIVGGAPANDVIELFTPPPQSDQ